MPEVQCRFLTTSDRRWSGVLRQTDHDIYCAPEYASLCGANDRAVPVAFYGEIGDSFCLIPLLIRELPARCFVDRTWRDACSPYGYPAIVTGPRTTPEGLRQMLAALRKTAADAGVISILVRMHPLIGFPAVALSEHGQVVRHGQTVYMDLTAPWETIATRIRSNHRTGVRKLIEAGFTVTRDDWSSLPAFMTIYRATMGRVGANREYQFSDEYFTGLRDALRQQLHLFVVRAPDGSPASAGLFTGLGAFVQYHLGGTAPDYLRAAPSKLMFYEVARWAKEEGFRFFHLGGGVGCREDSLFQFKAGFSPDRAEYFTYRIVTNPSVYLAAAKVTCGETIVPAAERNAFFPIYRNDPVHAEP